MEMNQSPRAIFWALLLVTLLAGAYVGSYCIMVDGGRFVLNPKTTFFEFRSKYRFGGDAVETFFRPLFSLDRQIRSDLWMAVEIDSQRRLFADSAP